MTHLIAVDVGTTSAKVVRFDARGIECGTAGNAYELIEDAPGQAEQDPRAVIDATLGAIRAVAGARPAIAGASPAIAGLSLSTAMHSLVGVASDGRPLTRLITWADMRAAAQAERLRRAHPDLHARTGTPIHPMAPLPKLVWLRENEPELFRSVRRWVGIKELVIHELTGEWAIDSSCASGTGLMSLEQLTWDADALTLAGITAEQLCPIVPTTHVLELSRQGLGIPLGTPVVVGAGDGPLANLGVGAVRPGVAACSIGTSGALRLVVERAETDPSGRLFCYAMVPGRWVVGGAINNGGSVLQWAGAALAPDLGEHAEDQLLELAREVPAGSDGLIMLPYLLSERAPHWSPLARGAYVGLRHFHGRGHLIRAAIEGVCQQLALVLASMRAAGAEVEQVRATGGFARSALWRQMLSDALAMPVQFPAAREGSAFGAAMLGMQALGMIDSIDRAADLIAIQHTVAPDARTAALYAESRALFTRLYDDLMPAFAVLDRAGVPRA